MQVDFYRYVDGEKIAIQIRNRTLYINDYYNEFTFEIALDGVRLLIDVLKDLRYFGENHVHLARLIRFKFGYQKCWSNNFVVSRAKPVLDVLTEISNFELDKDKLDKLNISNLKYIEAKLPSGVKKVDGKTLISLLSIDEAKKER